MDEPQDDRNDGRFDLEYQAWTIIANVSEGDWSKQTPEWREAASRWRDKFHSVLMWAAS